MSSYGPHFGEEAPLVGRGGSGTIFFTRCNLECVYCQNADISQRGEGDVVSAARLARMMLELQRLRCHSAGPDDVDGAGRGRLAGAGREDLEGVMSLQIVLKDPDETMTATMDWSARLDAGVTIATSSWTLPAGLTRVTDAISGQTTTVLLSGGTAGEDYLCTNTITTSDSQTLQRSGPLRVRGL